MYVIGIDPHRGSHAAVVIDRDERVIARLELPADRRQRQRLLAWAEPFTPRRWAIEGARGTGALLAQQLVRAGQDVVDVPPKLAMRVRILDTECADKSDTHDARSVAIAALRKTGLHHVGLDADAELFRLLARRHHDLTAHRTRIACRIHTLLSHLAEGRFPRRLRADQAAAILARIQPLDQIGRERKAMARTLLGELRRLEADIDEITARITRLVTASGTTLTTIHGVGPIGAAILIGYSGDITRFRDRDRYARYNGTAPLSASTSGTSHHRLNPYGNRQLNHALHIAAVTQLSHDTDGRHYYARKLAEHKTPKDAIRALKRRISDAAYRQLLADAAR